MTQVEFEEHNKIIPNYHISPEKNSFITGLLIKIKLAKDIKSANIIMIIFVVIMFGLFLYLLSVNQEDNLILEPENPENEIIPYYL